MLDRVRCLFGHHRVLRRSVTHDNVDFHGECRGCGILLVKDYRTGRWQPDEPEETARATDGRRSR
jgi:hypothetical protein